MSSRLSSLLVQDGLVSAKQVTDALQRQVIHGGTLDSNLIELKAVDEDALLACLGRASGLPTQPTGIHASGLPLPAVLELFTDAVAQRLHAVPAKLLPGGVLQVLVTDGIEISDLDTLALTVKQRIEPWVVLEFRFAEALDKVYGQPMPTRFSRLLLRSIKAHEGQSKPWPAPRLIDPLPRFGSLSDLRLIEQPAAATVAAPVAAVAVPVAAVATTVVAVAEPVAAVAAPVVAVTEPVAAVAAPVVAVTEPVAAVATTVVAVTEPIAAVAAPVVAVTEPIAAVAAPVVAETEPIAAVAAPVVAVAEPVAAPVVAVAEPVAAVAEPVVAAPPVAPVVEPDAAPTAVAPVDTAPATTVAAAEPGTILVTMAAEVRRSGADFEAADTLIDVRPVVATANSSADRHPAVRVTDSNLPPSSSSPGLTGLENMVLDEWMSAADWMSAANKVTPVPDPSGRSPVAAARQPAPAITAPAVTPPAPATVIAVPAPPASADPGPKPAVPTASTPAPAPAAKPAQTPASPPSATSPRNRKAKRKAAAVANQSATPAAAKPAAPAATASTPAAKPVAATPPPAATAAKTSQPASAASKPTADKSGAAVSVKPATATAGKSGPSSAVKPAATTASPTAERPAPTAPVKPIAEPAAAAVSKPVLPTASPAAAATPAVEPIPEPIPSGRSADPRVRLTTAPDAAAAPTPAGEPTVPSAAAVAPSSTESPLPELRPPPRVAVALTDGGGSPVSLEAAAELVAGAVDRDAIFEALCRGARSRAAFAAVFTIHGDVAFGRVALGDSWQDRQQVGRVAVQLDRPSPFGTVVKGRSPLLGPIGEQAVASDPMRALGRRPPLPAAIVPILVRSRTVALVYMDDDGRDLAETLLDELQPLFAEVSQCLVRLAQASKSGSFGGVADSDEAAPQEVHEAATSAFRPRPSRVVTVEPAAEQLTARLKADPPMTARAEAAASPSEPLSGMATVPLAQDSPPSRAEPNAPTAAAGRPSGKATAANKSGRGSAKSPTPSAAAPAAPVAIATAAVTAPIVTADLLELLQRVAKNPTDRAASRDVVALGASIVPSLIVRLKDRTSSAELRRAVVVCLAELPLLSTLEPLAERLFDSEESVRTAAAQALRNFPPSPALNTIRSRLRDALDDSDSRRSHQATEALSELHDILAVPQLIELIEHRDPLLSDAAGRALQNITKQDFGRSHFRWSGWWRRHQTEPRLQWLLAGLCHPNPLVRSSAQEELAVMSGDVVSYRFDLPQSERDTAARRWVDWWQQQGYDVV